MTIYIRSKGILAKKKMLEQCLNNTVELYSKKSQVNANDCMAGWGIKANTVKVKKLADKHQVNYLQLEDGFIGYAGHPAKGGHAVSVVVDDLGIYYDASKPSRLERLIKRMADNNATFKNATLITETHNIYSSDTTQSSEFTQSTAAKQLSDSAHAIDTTNSLNSTDTHSIELLARAQNVIELITRYGITKYNCYANTQLPDTLAQRLAALANGQESVAHSVNSSVNSSGNHSADNQVTNTRNKEFVLLVDQVAGDLSITGCGATEACFMTMVEQAKQDYPNATLLLRTHPDTFLGSKKGILAKCRLPDVHVITESCHPHALIKQVCAVYTVSSQLGFEALLLGKKVHCFGLPFYAGWGLTQDQLSSERRTKVSLPQLVAAALIEYPLYYDPILQRACEVEDAIALIALQYSKTARYKKLYMVGFSFWKRSFMAHFCQSMAQRLVFVKQPPENLQHNEQMLVWGAKYAEYKNVIRVEDGFIRSTGLGSNLCRPSSLSIDPIGIYFNNQQPSALEQALNYNTLTSEQLYRGEQLVKQLKHAKVSKYNVGSLAEFSLPATDKKRLLVVGQVDGDASILFGSNTIKSNQALLFAVRAKNPEAFIIFKPHPDVVTGNRAGEISAECLNKCVNYTVIDTNLTILFPMVDEMHTMTSLSGFEALIHGVNVVTWGQPFYAGWGLTTDINSPLRRTKKVDLNTLVYTTLVDYPQYIDWHTGMQASPEQIIEQIALKGSSQAVATTAFKRWQIKLYYLFETIIQSFNRTKFKN